MLHGSKFLAILTVGAMAAVCCTGCKGDASSASGITIAEEDMVYGATMRLDKTGFAVPVQYDDRSLDAAVMEVIANYYYAVQTQDEELFVATQLPLYHDYEMNTVYENAFTDAELLESSYTAWSEQMGGDYVYSLIDVTDCTASRIHTTSANILEMLDGLSQEADGTTFSDSVAHIYELTVDVYMALATEEIIGDGYTETCIDDQVLFVLQADDAWYVIFT